MRLQIIRSKNAASLYVVKSINTGKKRTLKVAPVWFFAAGGDEKPPAPASNTKSTLYVNNTHAPAQRRQCIRQAQAFGAACKQLFAKRSYRR